MTRKRKIKRKKMKQLNLKASQKKYTLEYIASQTNSILVGDAKVKISGAKSLKEATKNDLSFLSHNRYVQQVNDSAAGAIIVGKDFCCKDEKNYLLSCNPSKAFQQVLALFNKKNPQTLGISKNAFISTTCTLPPTVHIGDGCVIGNNVVVGAHTIISAGAIIADNVIIGKNCLIAPSVVIQESCVLGNRVIIQPGAVIGSCGYGYFTDENGIHEKIIHYGNVILEDDVEIGANTTIDRARFNSTIIGKGTKIDNLVQIGHNVHLGRNNLIVSQSGISGSTSTGNRVILGGQTGIVGHIHITNDVILTAKSGISKSINKNGAYAGVPAMPLQQYNRNCIKLRNIDKSIEKIQQLEKKVDQLEKMLGTSNLV